MGGGGKEALIVNGECSSKERGSPALFGSSFSFCDSSSEGKEVEEVVLAFAACLVEVKGVRGRFLRGGEIVGFFDSKEILSGFFREI